MSEPMSDERLAEIEAIAGAWSGSDHYWVVGDERVGTADILRALVAEVRRLRELTGDPDRVGIPFLAEFGKPKTR